MGICQSTLERKAGNGDVGIKAIADAGSMPKDPNYQLGDSMKSTPGVKNNSLNRIAYTLEIISPSEKTNLTEALSPDSIISPTLNFRSKTEGEKLRVVVGDDDDGFPFDEESEHRHPIEGIIVEKFIPKPCSSINGHAKEDSDTNDNHLNGDNGLDEHHFDDLSKKREEDDDDDDDEQIMKDHLQMMCHRIYNQYNTPDLAGSKSNGLVFKNIGEQEVVKLYNNCRHATIPRTTDHIDGKESIQYMIQSIEGAHEKRLINESISNDRDHLETFHKSQPDPPPLVAPPHETAVVISSSNTDTSVNPAIVANFNKMKSQVNRANKLEKQRRHQEKIEDRRRDIQCYKDLWGEYNVIKERVTKQREINAKSPSPKKNEEPISLNDSTKWLVDSSTLNSMLYFDNPGLANGLGCIHEDDQKSQTNFSLMTESTIYSQKKLLKRMAAQRQKTISEYSVNNKKDYGVQTGKLGEQQAVNYQDIDENMNNNRSITMDLDGSIISDLGNGSNNSSMISDTERAVDNDDYGVFRRCSRMSIKSSVPTHTDDFYAQLGDDFLEDTEAFFSAQTPRKANCAAMSFSKYLQENCLPSVSIENAETGMIRWRKFPKSNERDKLNRKITFLNDSHEPSEERTGMQPDHGSGIDVKVSQNYGQIDVPPSLIRDKEKNVGLTHMVSVSTKDSKTKTSSIESSWDTCEATDKEIKEMEEDPLRLVRKVGPQLNDLLAQLKDNGLGE